MIDPRIFSKYGEASYRTGDTENRSYHLRDFTEDEERQVYAELHRLARRR